MWEITQPFHTPPEINVASFRYKCSINTILHLAPFFPVKNTTILSDLLVEPDANCKDFEIVEL